MRPAKKIGRVAPVNPNKESKSSWCKIIFINKSKSMLLLLLPNIGTTNYI